MENERSPFEDAQERAKEAVGKSMRSGEWLHLVYELWQEDLIDEDLYLQAIQRDLSRIKEKG